MQRKCACGNRTQSTEKCEQCQSSEGVMQCKLTVGDSNDPLELEADRVADQVLSMPLNSSINSSPVKVQRLTSTSTNHSGTVPKSVENTLAMSGSPLSNDLQQNMGQRFGYDFSSVRIHNNESAARSARDVNANAYTVGTDIVFDRGQYMPQTTQGKRLLAHELTHVIQQDDSGVTNHRLQRDMVRDRDENFYFESREDAQRRFDNIIRLIPDPAREDNFLIEWRWDPTNPSEDAWTRGTISRSRDAAEERRDQLVRIVESDGRWFIEKDDSLAPEETSESAEPPSSDASPPTENDEADGSSDSENSDTTTPNTTTLTCRRFQRETQAIIDGNPRNYPTGVTMERHVIGSGDTFSGLAEDTVADNNVTLASQLAIELNALNTHVSANAMRIGDCVLVLRNWTHASIGSLPSGVTSSTALTALPTDVKEAIATVYGEQWNTGTNSQEQQKYIWFSMRLRIGTSLRGANLSRVLDPAEYHAIGGNLYNDAITELNSGSISSTGISNAKDAVLNNFTNSVPNDAGVFYFHWLNSSTSQSCFDATRRREEGSGASRRSLTSAEILTIERTCAQRWAVHQGWDANLSAGAGWHKRIRSDGNVRIGSMYIYRGF